MPEHASLEELSAYLDEPSTSPPGLAAHARTCKVCRRHLARLAQVGDAIEALPALPAPPGELSRVIETLSRHSLARAPSLPGRGGWWRKMFSFDVRLPHVALAAAALALFFVGGFLTAGIAGGDRLDARAAFGPGAGPRLQPGPGSAGPTFGAVAGAALVPLGTELGRYFGGLTAGLLVVEVADGSPFATAGVRPGDVLVRIGDAPLVTLADLAAALTTDAASLTLEWIREGSHATTLLPLR